eukprot:scaffold36636_cov16-Tisochrysis_lutea.AAC.1
MAAGNGLAVREYAEVLTSMLHAKQQKKGSRGLAASGAIGNSKTTNQRFPKPAGAWKDQQVDGWTHVGKGEGFREGMNILKPS